MHNKLVFACVLFFLTQAQLNAQSYPGDRPVTCVRHDIPIHDLFEIIHQQTGMIANYNLEFINPFHKISPNLVNEPLDNVLAWLLREDGFTWMYSDDALLIHPKKPGDPDLGELPVPRPRTILGLVTDQTGHPLPGTSIFKGSDALTSTDTNGKFFLRNVEHKAVLLVSAVGYQTMHLASYEDSVCLQLTPVVFPLREVEIEGKMDEDFTGSVTKLENRSLAAQLPGHFLNLLQGRAPGLFISPASGLPGGTYRIRLRGKNSIESTSSPLILVDGVPLPGNSFNETFTDLATARTAGTTITNNPLNLLNVNDISTIEILKDADATSIYGAKGANGVIVIQSKAPESEDNGFSAHFSKGIGSAVKLNEYLHTQTYLQMRREGLRNDGRQPSAFDYDLNVWNKERYTDWQKEMIGGVASIADGYVAITGERGVINYRLSSGLRKETTLYPSADFKYDKGGANGMLHFHTNSRRLQFNLSGNYTADNRLLPAIDLTTFSTLPPNAPAGYKSGNNLNFSDGFTNPYAYLLRTDKAITRNVRVNLNGRWEIGQTLAFQANIGLGTWRTREIERHPQKAFDPANRQYSYAYFFNHRYSTFSAGIEGKFRKKIGQHTLSITTGFRIQNEIEQQNNFKGSGYESDDVLNQPGADTIIPMLGIKRDSRFYSVYNRGEWRMFNKYSFAITGSSDWSSTLGKRQGFFGTVAASWLFGREHWIKKLRFINFGNLRSSVGVSGNDGYVRNTSGNYIPWITTGNTGNFPSYSWEKIRRAEIGMDLKLFNNRLSATFNYFNNRSTDQLLTAKATANGDYFPVNYPAIVRNMGVEIDMDVLLIKRGVLSWNMLLNLTVPRNQLLAFPKLDQSNYRNLYSIEKSLDMLQGFGLVGVDPKTGLYSFHTRTGNTPSAADYIYGKDYGPFVYGGWQNNVSIKGFEFCILFKFSKQNNINPLLGTNIPGMMGNQLTAVWEKRWQAPGNGASFQKLTGLTETDAARAFDLAIRSNGRLVDASYFRCQNIILAYNAKTKWMKKIKTTNCRLYVQALNLFTLTKYPGRDPDIFSASSETYPSLRVYSAGLQVSFGETK